MKHLDDETLQCWVDGEVEDAHDAEECSSHVSMCAECRARVDGVRELGSALRSWAETWVPVSAGATDAIMARLHTAGALAPASGTRRVVPLPIWRRRSLWAVGPVALAAAAALLVAITRSHRVPTSTRVATVSLRAAVTQVGPVAPTSTDDDAVTEPGSELLSFEPGGKHTSYAVLTLQAKEHGMQTALVWLDESTAVQ